ncbi:MAG: hypothetical protein H0W84_05590 [Bacteroidetes bacterium]|nr:hypothetical protein [Bacteroidota bacterium]
MRKILSPTFILLFIVLRLSSQTPTKYFQFTNEARESFKNEEYKNAALLYSQAFQVNSGKAFCHDRCNAARANAKAGYIDSAFYQLFKVTELYDFSDYETLTNDPYLISLHSDKRWNEVLDKVKKNIGKAEGKLNKALVIVLDSIYCRDQTCRLNSVSINNQFGTGSPEAKEISKVIKRIDSINLTVVLGIIDNYGWLGKNIVGAIGNSTLSLVIQRADIKVQEKYLPVLREAFKKNNADPYDLAILEDIVALKRNGKQIYGSQLKQGVEKKYFILPIENPENVNERRNKLGLNTMDEYLENWKMTWDITKYRTDLIIVEEKKIQY